MIRILNTGPLNTVQDLGRTGFRNIGVTVSGAMDSLALKLANLLLGNIESTAGIEIQTFPFRLRFEQPVAFALTGATCTALLDGHPLPPWWSAHAQAGQILEISAPRQGARAYLGLQGELDVPIVMGSRSTSLRGSFGGLHGRALQADDTLGTLAAGAYEVPRKGAGIVPPAQAMREYFPVSDNGELLLRAIPAAEHDVFGVDAERFWAQSWKVTARSDRTGYRLAGEPIQPTAPLEMRSHGVIPGVVQVPPGGEPIIQMSEANTAGGYPKIAGIIDGDFWRLGQANIGSRLRFVRCDLRTAITVDKAIDAYLADIRTTLPLVASALKTIEA